MTYIKLRKIPEWVVRASAIAHSRAGGFYRSTGLVHLMWYVKQGVYPEFKLKKEDKEQNSRN